MGRVAGVFDNPPNYQRHQNTQKTFQFCVNIPTNISKVLKYGGDGLYSHAFMNKNKIILSLS